ncbi:LIC_10463 family lipoprotein [Leptospira borgpetersenii]|uniref:LIC_10463 family lipoprotein n=1 Tax=Leptospira borgpetersenii TaxID=174 RepID=UPI0020204E04|nr:hypothetical protein [Leptospira borgpetersenii]URD70491.1 hypothetical protein LIX26_02935 [Leptospira borgpetersenii]UVD73669.1 hypothetical protein NU962_02940 [Leptospira borgpetersenii]UVD76864.1 hypothetical protein LIX27_02950 [Leptospira borgpetersenii]UZW33422.1 hypothetical protein OR565_02940 [Leptospira borgpetersenii]
MRNSLRIIVTMTACMLIYCQVNGGSERLVFIQNEQDGIVRLQSFVHGKIYPEKNIQNYEFTLNQSENVQGIFQVDSTDPDLRVRFLKRGFLFDSKRECADTNLGSTYSCKIEIPLLEKGRYYLTVYGKTNMNETDFNLFVGIFGKGYVDVEASVNN